MAHLPLLLAALLGGARAERLAVDLRAGGVSPWDATVAERNCPLAPEGYRPSGWQLSGADLVLPSGGRRPLRAEGEELHWIFEDGGLVIAGLGGEAGARRMIAFDLATGAARWERSDLPSRYATGLEPGLLVVFGADRVTTIRAATGETVASAPSSPHGAVCRGLSGAHAVLNRDHLHLVDAASGQIRWSAPSPQAEAAVLAGGRLVAGRIGWEDAELYVYDAQTGALQRRIPLPEEHAGGDFRRIYLQALDPDRVAVETWRAWE